MIDVAHHGNHRRTRNLHHPVVSSRKPSIASFSSCSSTEITCRVRAKLPRHVLHQLAVQRLVHRHKHALHQQRRNQVLAAHIQLLRQVLHADAFGHRNRLGNRQRLLSRSSPRHNAAAAGSPSSGLPSPSRSAGRRAAVPAVPPAASRSATRPVPGRPAARPRAKSWPRAARRKPGANPGRLAHPARPVPSETCASDASAAVRPEPSSTEAANPVLPEPAGRGRSKIGRPR